MKTLCVHKCKLGSNVYYLTKMLAGDLIDAVGLASEMPEWDDMTADEKMQREPDINRVVNEIVPYFVEDPDKFFGSIIVDIYSGFENMIFEPIVDIVPTLSAAYQFAMKDVGFLSAPGGERLIALDGQHRLLAMKIGIKGNTAIPACLLKNRKMTPQMEKLVPHPELAKEEISVIFVEHCDNRKIRKIFNVVNKTSRLTGRGDNIITSDEDIFAVISRRLFSEGEVLEPVGEIELVNWKSNTLSERSKQLTTISALYTSAEIILKDFAYSSKRLPQWNEIENAYSIVKEFWRELLEGLSIYREYLRLTAANEKVSDLRKNSLLMRPVTQMALAYVAYKGRQKKVPWKAIVEKLDAVDWSFENPIWTNLLVTGTVRKKMITGKEAIREAGMVISYMVMKGEMTDSEINEVNEIMINASNGERRHLPI